MPLSPDVCSVHRVVSHPRVLAAVFGKLNHHPLVFPQVDAGAGDCERAMLPRKEVIQPHLPVRLPCYDFVPVASPTLGRCALAVRSRTSGVPDSHDVTGGVYKARVRIHRATLLRGY